jgi:hypothetical protein
MRSWAEPIANVGTWKGEKSLETYFPVSAGYIVVTLQIVPGMHLVTFIRIVEKYNDFFCERQKTEKAVKKENFF